MEREWWRNNGLNFNRNKLRGLVFFSSLLTVETFIHMNEGGVGRIPQFIHT